MTRLLVCGSRDWSCVTTILAWLMPFQRRWKMAGGPAPLLIHGANGKRDEGGKAYEGADEIAHDVALEFGWRLWPFPVTPEEWRRIGRSAGPLRNQRMFDEGKPTRGLAFGRLEKSGEDVDSGTGGMVKILNRGGALVTVVPRPGIVP
jgi:hypothetical protein